MRNVKILTSKDHVLIIIESTEQDDEITCASKTTGARVFPAPFTAISLEGTYNNFYENEDSSWALHHSWNTPRMFFRTSNVSSGSTAATANTRLIGLLPKKREFLDSWVSTLGEYEMNVAFETNRESHVTVVEGSTIRKMDANTFIELPMTTNDEIIFE